MDENIIKTGYRNAMDGIVSSDEEKTKISEMFDNRTEKVTDISRKGRRGISKTAVAAIVLASILTLGGGVVWAMTNSALKDYFFNNSDKQFEEMYKDIGKTYDLGEYTAVLEGSVYDKSVEQGYISISFWDKEGNPVDLMTNAKYFSPDYYQRVNDCLTVLRHTQCIGIRIGEEKLYFMVMNEDTLGGRFIDNNLFYTLSRLGVDGPDYYSGKELKFLLLDQERYDSMINELTELSEQDLCTYTWDPDTKKLNEDFNRDEMQPEVVEVMNRYEPMAVHYLDIPAQKVTINDNLKLTIGRTDILFEVEDRSDYSFKNVTMIREDGTRIEFEREYGSDLWRVKDMDPHKGNASGHGNGKKQTTSCSYGFILGANEKVQIEFEGQIYE